MKISKRNAEHYLWGEKCDGWHLVKNSELSVIHERMPPNSMEVRHYHRKAQQFFFVLKGIATIEVNGEIVELIANEGIEIPANIPHQMFNRTDENIEFLVISQPNSKDDRVAE
jgi:mannose-6-phosphate isomerase-like protein (cupin superfamily)